MGQVAPTTTVHSPEPSLRDELVHSWRKMPDKALFLTLFALWFALFWFLGNPTSAGMHAGTLTFTAATPGSYRYLCPVPGHAQKGMAGAFTVG